MKYKWIVLFALILLLCLGFAVTVFLIGFRMLGWPEGMWVLMMIYGYNTFSAITKEMVEKVQKIRKERA